MQPTRVLIVGHGLIGRQRAGAAHALGAALPVSVAGTVRPRRSRSEPVRRRAAPSQPRGGRPGRLGRRDHRPAPRSRGRRRGGGARRRPSRARREAARPPRVAGTRPSGSRRRRRAPRASSATTTASCQHVADALRGDRRRAPGRAAHDRHAARARRASGLGARAGSCGRSAPAAACCSTPAFTCSTCCCSSTPESRLRRTSPATRGFWGTGSRRTSWRRSPTSGCWRPCASRTCAGSTRSAIEAGGEDGYAIVEGRGGNYGPQTVALRPPLGMETTAAGRSQRRARRSAGTMGVEDPQPRASSSRPSCGAGSAKTAERRTVAARDLPEALAVAELCDADVRAACEAPADSRSASAPLAVPGDDVGAAAVALPLPRARRRRRSRRAGARSS